MNKLDEQRKMVTEGVKKFEKTAQEIHKLADKMHEKMKKLHIEATATRKHLRAVRERTQFGAKTRQTARTEDPVKNRT